LREAIDSFCRALEHLQSLLEYQPIYHALPDNRSAFARRVRDVLRGYAWIQLVQVPLRYPMDHFTLLARTLGLKRDPDRPVWALRTEGVLAVDRVCSDGLPCTDRVVSVAGPGVTDPTHVAAMIGYPIAALRAVHVANGPVRVIKGGALTGEPIPDNQQGLDTECTSLTILPEPASRELLGWIRPGRSRRSYSHGFVGNLRRVFAERFTTALRGERRPCVSCGFCEQVCPAGIMPQVIHKYLHQDLLDDVEAAGADLCVECGLCSYVCPSKIELRRQIIDAKEAIRREHDREGDA
jgi:Na(+)-translocating NADH:ubiquinone oxidoreductase A subunit